MKKEFLIALAVFLLSCFTVLFAQPSNDDVCNALTIKLDSTAVSISNIGASIQSGEESITPPGSTTCEFQTWCNETNGVAVINHSLWFKFVAPMSTAVYIDICGSTFDSQLALYEVGDCKDWNTFELLLANDNQTGCGIEDGFSSTLRIECLNPGQEYYLLVDDWRDSTNANIVDTGEVVLVIETAMKVNSSVGTGTPVIEYPVCPGGNQGLIDIVVISGVEPITYNWSNGATTQDIYNLTAGTYFLTISDFCGSSQTFSYTLKDPQEVPDIVLGNYPIEVVHPTNCGTGKRGGQISVIALEGIPPHKYSWSNGDSTAVLTALPDGTYTVTVTDFCGIKTSERTYHIGAEAGENEIYSTNQCNGLQIGIDNSSTGGDITTITYSIDQTTESGIACRGGEFIAKSATWRVFDLANDFGLNGAIDLNGVEVMITSEPNFELAPGVEVKFTAFLASDTALDAPDLELISLDSIQTFIGSIPEYTPFIIPLKTDNLSASDIIAIKVETLTSSGDGHRFDFAANTTPTTQTTYLSSIDCGIPNPIQLSDIGFEEEIIMNLFLANETGLTYEWSGQVDNPTSPTPTILGGEGIYGVTITDLACGTTFTDEVRVNCPLSTEAIVKNSISINPNPSNGLFIISIEGENLNALLEIFDLQGKRVFAELIRINHGAEQNFDFSHLSKGVYFTKLLHGNSMETQKLIIQ